MVGTVFRYGKALREAAGSMAGRLVEDLYGVYLEFSLTISILIFAPKIM